MIQSWNAKGTWKTPFKGLRSTWPQTRKLVLMGNHHNPVNRGHRGQIWPCPNSQKQTCAYWSTILLGTIYWPFFGKNCNSSIGIGIVIFGVVIFAFVLLLLVIKILNIGLYLGNIWYCFDIVHWHTLIPIND